MGCTHALSPLPAHQCVESLLSIRGPLPHPSLYKVSSAYEGCLVPIDMYLYTAPPGLPTGVTAVQSGPTSVSVSWTAPTSGGPVTRYDIYYVANGGPSTSGGSTNSTSYNLTNLQVGVQYNISVIAVGTSLPSQNANVTTLSESHIIIIKVIHPSLLSHSTSVPSTPSLTIAQVTSTSITVMWSQPGGEIGTTYTLSYTYQGPCAEAGGGGSVSVGNATQYTITGLQEFSVYTLTITASIGVGSSPPASVLVNTSSAGESDDIITKWLTPLLSPQLLLLLLTTSLKRPRPPLA